MISKKNNLKELKEKNEVLEIEKNISTLKERLLDKKPSHFSKKDVARAFFGSIVFGFTFALKNLLIQIAVNLQIYNVIAIVLSTLTIMTAEIYYIGYRRVPNNEKKKRKFLQFWFKRITTYYTIAIFVSTLLVYLYNINTLSGVSTTNDIINIIISISMPAGIGASIGDLLKQF